MAHYVYLGKFNAAGKAGVIKDTYTARQEQMKRVVAASGGTLLLYEFAMGTYDFVLVLDVPDRKNALALSTLAELSGTVTGTMIELHSGADMDEMAKLIAASPYRAPGELSK